MAPVTIYTKSTCGYCLRAKALLTRKGVAFEEIPVDGDPAAQQEMARKANGGWTVPQIFVGSTHVGGCDDLFALERAGKLDPLLSASTFGWSVRTNTAFHVSRAIDAQALLSYVGRATIVQGWNAARTRVSFGIRDKLMADRLSLTMRILDPFSTARDRSATLDPAFTQINNRLRPVRAVQLSATWTFGRQRKRDGDQIDLSSGSQ